MSKKLLRRQNKVSSSASFFQYTFCGSLRQLLSYNHGYTEKQKQLQMLLGKSKAGNSVDY